MGYKFIADIYENGKVEGVNHVGSQDFGNWMIDMEEHTSSLIWNNGWIDTITHALNLAGKQKTAALRRYNKLAIDYIEAYSKKRIEYANDSIEHVIKMSNIKHYELVKLKEVIKKKARIAIHFHPYRIGKDSKTAIESMIEAGQYNNQFETTISNGSLTAFEGGKRDIWENLLFGQIYKESQIPNSLRPKYGSLALMGYSDGPSPRFGSCYFLIKPELSKYATFTYLDSYTNPKEKGTINFFEEILACLLSECFERDYALGKIAIRPDELVRKINQSLDQDYALGSEHPMSKNLDHYIEAQIHTEISLLNDVDYLIVDAAYRYTEYENLFKKVCELNHIELFWNEGRELEVKNIPANFRGSEMPTIAREIAVNNRINAYVLGLAERRYKEEIKDEEIRQDKNQQLKYLWHTLIKYGHPIVKG